MHDRTDLLITGASGHLGSYLVREAVAQGLAVAAWSGISRGHRFGVPMIPVDLADQDQVTQAFRVCKPAFIIHAAAVASVAACRSNPKQVERINVQVTRRLAELAAESSARLVFVSTDLVFDGATGNYGENDSPNSLSIYGRSKAEAEAYVLEASGQVVARLSLLYGPCLAGRPHFFDEQITIFRSGKPVLLFKDEWRTPLSFVTAARALLDLARVDFAGIVHVAGQERLSRLEMGQRLAKHLGIENARIIEASRDSMRDQEPRPRDTSLDCSRWRSLRPNFPRPTFEQALAEMHTGKMG
jgi:dTDP-4-dehydrorhamnose reductase